MRKEKNSWFFEIDNPWWNDYQNKTVFTICELCPSYKSILQMSIYWQFV